MRLRNSLIILMFTVLTVALGRLPLLDGLTYELAVVVGLAGWLTGIAVGSGNTRSLSGRYVVGPSGLAETPSRRLGAGLFHGGWVVLVAVLAAAIPPILAGAAAGCAWERGLPVYLFVTVPAVLFGLAIGALSRVVGGDLWHRRWFVVFILALASGFLTVYEVIAGPRAVFHNLVVGVVSNTAYLGLDGEVRIASHDWGHRVAVLLVTTLLYLWAAGRLAGTAASSLPGESAGRRLLELESARLRWWARGAVVILAVLAVLGEPFGFGSGRRALGRRLSSKVETAHLRLHFRPGSAVENFLETIPVEAEWAYERVSRLLDLGDDVGDQIDVYVYEDPAEQLELTGARGYLFAKPWLGEIHTRLEGGSLAAFEHELVHAVAARFGLPLVNVSARYGLIEGVAEAIAGGYAEHRASHEVVAAALRGALLPRAGSLTGTLGFAAGESGTSYLATASFCGFLLERYGPAKLRAVYPWGDFESAYGRTIGELDGEWRRFLEETEVGPRALAWATRGFDRELSPPFFRQECARLGRRDDGCGVVSVVDVAAEERRWSERDRASVLGLKLRRDASLELMFRHQLDEGAIDAASAILESRERLGVAPSGLRRALEASVNEPTLRRALLAIEAQRGGHECARPLAHDLDSLVALEGALVRGARGRELYQFAMRVGGCAVGFEELEARALLRVARLARRDGDHEQHMILSQNAIAIAPPATRTFIDVERELALADFARRRTVSDRKIF